MAMLLGRGHPSRKLPRESKALPRREILSSSPLATAMVIPGRCNQSIACCPALAHSLLNEGGMACRPASSSCPSCPILLDVCSATSCLARFVLLPERSRLLNNSASNRARSFLSWQIRIRGRSYRPSSKSRCSTRVGSDPLPSILADQNAHDLRNPQAALGGVHDVL